MRYKTRKPRNNRGGSDEEWQMALEWNGTRLGARCLRGLALVSVSTLVLAACDSQPLDFDLRGLNGGFSTAQAATGALADRPREDNRGVISYPNYQVAVARRGDTLRDVASRVGGDVGAIARFNAIDPDVALRRGEIVALPTRVAEPSPATGASATGPIQPVDISAVAGGAIDRAPATPGVRTTALPAAQPKAQTGKEPVRHRVERGETAFTVARLYGVPVKALGEWNSLGSDFAIREGQFLLIPVAQQAPPRRSVPEPETAPGEGSPTPTPPSAAKPLPQDEAPVPVQTAAPEKPVVDVGKTTAKSATKARFTTPVQGSIIRAYKKGTNEGINIKASPGTSVKAADAGTVAAITKSAEGVPIVVLRHTGNLLTVYANVTDVSVAKGDRITRGQSIAKLRNAPDDFVHFEVREGFDSVDPAPYLD